jgi:lipoyl(octanoyl) transferase
MDAQIQRVSFRRLDNAAAAWAVSAAPVAYEAAVRAMELRVEAVAAGAEAELVWLLEHPALYTAGVSAKASDLLTPDRFPVYATGRGGQLTYHGPGQRVVYLMLDLRRRGRDLRAFVGALEAWIIDALARLGATGESRCGRIGVWVVRRPHGLEPREDKIAAIGIKVRRWVSFHGVSLNVAPCLEHFSGIVPCGINDHGVTSLAEMGLTAGMPQADHALRSAFEQVFGPTVDSPPPSDA